MLLINWLRRVLQWLAEVPTFWSFLLVLFSSITLPLAVCDTTEDAFRYAGLVLQMVGVSVVAYTLRGRGKAFENKSVFQFAVDWFRRAPSPRQRTCVLEASATASANASMTADLSVWRGQRLDQPIEVQLDDLYANLMTLRDDLANLSVQVGQQMTDLRTGLEFERAERTNQLQDTKRTLRQVTVDSLYLEVAGFWWLVAGIILATLPYELATGMRLLSL
jgi:hypothetical protein